MQKKKKMMKEGRVQDMSKTKNDESEVKPEENQLWPKSEDEVAVVLDEGAVFVSEKMHEEVMKKIEEEKNEGLSTS